MEQQPAFTDPYVYAVERRELLLHILRVHQQKGFKVDLPIGMTIPENWLLDIVDTSKLIQEIESGKNVLDLIKFKRDRKGHVRGNSNLTDGLWEQLHISTPGQTPTKRNPFEHRISETNGQKDVYSDDSTLLPLPQLQTGLQPAEIKDLAFLVFSALCPSGRDDLLSLMRQQLDLSSKRASEMHDALQWVTGSRPTTPRTPEATNGGHYAPKAIWSQDKRASLQLLAQMLEQIRPSNFERFKGFVQFRGTVARVLVESLQLAAREAWIAPPTSVGAKTLIARLKGAVRRLDVQTADDYDEMEYTEGAQAVSASASAIAESVRDGWNFPWSLRVRLAELLLRSIFDDLDEGTFSYVQDHTDILEVLRTHMWPVLGVSGLVDSVCLTWAHFQKFLVTTANRELLGHVQTQIQQLARQTRNPEQTPVEQELAAQVGEKILEWTEGRVCDYHSHYKDGEQVGGQLSLLRFVLQLTGNTRTQVSAKMSDVIMGSMDAEFKRRMDELPHESDAVFMQELVKVTWGLMQDESSHYSPALEQHLPGAKALAALRLYVLFSHELVPWLGNVETLDDDELEAIRASSELEPQLVAAMDVRNRNVDEEVLALLRSMTPWSVATHLQRALSCWVSNQTSLFDTCLTRNLETEDWKNQGGRNCGFGASAREVMSITEESLDVLFRLNIPIAPEIVAMHMESVDNMLRRYATAVKQQLGPCSRLVPPTPPLTRYKQKEAQKQEQSESGTGPKPSIFSLHTPRPFLESVPKINNSLQHLTAEHVACMAASLQYLITEAAQVAETATHRYKTQKLSRVSGMVEDLLETGRDALAQSMEHALKFLATKLVFWDGRSDLLEHLYRHRVAGCKNTIASMMVPSIQAHLEQVSEILPVDLINYYAKLLLEVCSQGLERVLLDGGPTRLFIPSDVALIDADIRELKKLFYAEGSGLPPPVIESTMKSVSDTLRVMSMDTGPLLNDLQRFRLNRKQAEEALFLKVASHRADHAASKFLKEPPYNMGKKLK